MAMRLLGEQPPRDRWRVELVGQETRGGLVHFEYVIREPDANPFLLNNHKAQIRTDHQRIVTGPNGGLMHVSGVEVRNVEQFMATDQRAYRWVDKDASGRWRDNRGRVLAPYLFASAPWASGEEEELDPQWQRETYTLSLDSQVQNCIERYQRRAERKGYVGDRRGTTLNLQVGASTDDAHEDGTGAVTTNATSFINDNSAELYGLRWQNVTIASGATIDDAILSVYMTSGTGNDEPGVRLRGHDTDNAAAFAANSTDISGRPDTTASVDWNDTDLGTAGGLFEEYGCSATGGAGLTIEAVVQEIIDRGGWASGNALAVTIAGLGLGATRDLSIDFYDADSARGAKLDIDYTAAGGGGITGTAAATLQRATAALAGTHAQTGTITATARMATASLTGTMHPAGAAAATLQRATASLTGTHGQSGSIAATAQAATASLAGIKGYPGTISATAQRATSSLSGVMHPAGSIAATAQRATAALTGTHAQTGTIAATAQAATAAASGSMGLVEGAIAATVTRATAALSGVMAPAGSIAATVTRATASLTGTHAQSGAIAATAQMATAALSGLQRQTGSIAATAAKATASLTGTFGSSTATIAVTVTKATASLTGAMAPAGAIAATLRRATASLTGGQPIVHAFQTVKGAAFARVERPAARMRAAVNRIRGHS